MAKLLSLRKPCRFRKVERLDQSKVHADKNKARTACWLGKVERLDQQTGYACKLLKWRPEKLLSLRSLRL
ncbi:MAG: hypothetical protein IJ563_10140 [Selenomonadaceae bacterium]|nr:hypothetical protein [Selenomonadaceae bacterium]